MKLTTALTLSGQPLPLSGHDIVLDLSAAGRAMLTVVGTACKGQVITVDLGYNGDLRRWFTGYVYDTIPAERGATRLMCRELAGVLAGRFPVSQQHPTLRSLLAWLTQASGITFLLPEQADYTDQPIPNFTSAGTGYQLLDNAGRAFGIPDFCWYQQPDGAVYVGSYAQSRWHDRDMPMDAAWSAQRAGNIMTLSPLPALRPGATIGGQRITRVRLSGDQMSLTLTTPGKVLKSTDRRRIEAEFPELAAGMHLPSFGRVEAISDRALAGQLCDPYRPRYAVDVQPLNEQGEPDSAAPLYRAVPLPVLLGGPEQGLLQYPAPGTVVELGFAFGRADRPFVRTILGTDWPLPTIAPGEQLQQQRDEVQQRTDQVGNQVRCTDRTQRDQARIQHRQADEYRGEFGSHQLQVAQHSIEEVGGIKRLEALGAIELLAGDDLLLAALGNGSVTAAGDLVELVGQVRRSVAGELLHLEAPKHWAGSDSVNIYRLLLELMQTVKQLANTLASHTHPDIGPPEQSDQLLSFGEQAGKLANQLSPIVE
ncbi:hypothetical protein [Aeromonas enteropelogenes]|uniref:hypothetical protein n=1 Tax=Aeromonas enteropelogenes TaxID=29489 RepID=UPI003BA04AB7